MYLPWCRDRFAIVGSVRQSIRNGRIQSNAKLKPIERDEFIVVDAFVGFNDKGTAGQPWTDVTPFNSVMMYRQANR